MNEATALLNEYKALTGNTDEKSMKRKDEILARLSEINSDEVKAEAKEMTDKALNEIESDLKNIRSQIAGDYDILPLAYIAKHYFGKSRAWLYQRINGYKVGGREYTLNAEQKATFNAALQDLAKRIGSVSIA